MKTRNFLFLLAIVASLISCKEEYPDLEDGMYAEFQTSMGPFVAQLYFEEAPLTVGNFVSLAEGTNSMVDSTFKGKKYYEGLIFHRVMDGFVIQGGDPTGTGSGGPGYRFPDEFVDSLRHDSAGILSMANAGPGTNGSQFFVTLAPTPHLNDKHSVFGKVVKGMDVVEAIGKVETGQGDRPTKDVVMNEVNIIRKGKAAKNFDADKVMQNEMKKIEDRREQERQALEEKINQNAHRFAELKKEADSLESGVKIYYEEKGDGPKPKIGQKVMMLYQGYFEDGRIFDTNDVKLAKEMGVYNRQRDDMGMYGPTPMDFSPDTPLIQGFKDALQAMQVGDKAVVFIPSELGYGKSGRGRVIPPDTNLVFVLEMVEMANASE
ncbi:MAG: peptidylprolyl isomerase [Bacteroidota bacterium]|nr:peptidylprolyl isomerase [Bacteroidota bacterium]